MLQIGQPLRKRRVAGVLITSLVVALGLCASPARAQSSVEAHLVALVNGERTSRGIAALTVKSDLAVIARHHSEQMAASGHIYHNGSLASQVGGGWTAIAENVGSGSTVDAVHKALMDSAPHRVNILGSFNQVGMGIASSGGILYVTEVFVRRSGGGQPGVHHAVTIHSHAARPRPAPPKPAPPREPERAVGVLLELIALDSPHVDPRSGLAVGV